MRSISKSIRSNRSGDRTTSNPEQQSMGFYTGVVMDDQDDQRMGRLWVYVPALSATRFDPNSTPNYGGTTPDRQSGRIDFDEKLRLGWLLCFPLMPFFGGDDYRVNLGPDGRDSKKGDTNSYGIWYQPRIGDYVAVMFDHSNPTGAFWIGCVPKQYRNFMVPGSAGVPSDQIDEPASSFGPDDGTRDTSPRPIKSNAPGDALIPALDRASTPTNPTRQGNFPSNTFARNLLGAGMICDPLRGAGTSTARRESPSYVFGFKSAGWNYESEKFQKDVDGRQFQDRQSELRTHNAMGHQFVMDDHPDYQSIRLRTSNGNQLYMNDSCETPFIYINTPRGKVWIELVDDGDINVFGEGNFNIHAGQDINLTADRDINFEAFGNMNLLVHQDQRIEVLGRTDWAFGASGNRNRNILDHGSINHTITGNQNILVEENSDHTIIGDHIVDIGGKFNERIGGDFVSQTDGTRYTTTSGFHSLEASSIFMNSGITSGVESPDSSDLPVFPIPSEKFGPPTRDQIENCENPELQQYLGSVVPQHQPWPLRCGTGNTFGTNGYVGARPIQVPNAIPPRSDNTSCSRSKASDNFRRGSSRSDSIAPNDFVGNRSGQEEPGIYTGVPFSGTQSSEQPQWKLMRALRVGESNTSDSFRSSRRVMDFIRQQDVFQPTPVLDNENNIIIGYNHRIQSGETIGGVELTDDFVSLLRRTSGTYEGAITVSREEANMLLEQEIERLEAEVRQTLGSAEVTQDQFDSLVSFSRNVGMNTIRNTQEGRKTFDDIKDRKIELTPDNVMPFVHLDGFVSCNHVDRRRSELDQFSEIPDSDGIVEQNASLNTGDNPLVVGDWIIQRDVVDAINAAADSSNLVSREFMYSIAAQESGFNPSASSRTSSAKGLYQFTDATARRFGLDSSNVFDPVDNANAAVQLFEENANILMNGVLGGSSPSETDLYLAHFLGPGNQSAGTGASGFLDNLQNNPNDTPASNPAFQNASEANRNVFFDAQGNQKTYQQVFDYFNTRITRRVAQFGPSVSV